jgi:hypothetical protein
LARFYANRAEPPFNLQLNLGHPPGRSLSQQIPFGDKSLHQLQAADLVAREAFKHFDNMGVRKTRIPVKRLGDSLNFINWDRPTLEYLRDNGGPEDLELLTSWGSTVRPQPPEFTMHWKNF